MEVNQFYCVSCRKKVMSNYCDICVKTFKNKKIKGGVPALVSHCETCGNKLIKFIKHEDKIELTNMFGKC